MNHNSWIQPNWCDIIKIKLDETPSASPCSLLADKIELVVGLDLLLQRLALLERNRVVDIVRLRNVDHAHSLVLVHELLLLEQVPQLLFRLQVLEVLVQVLESVQVGQVVIAGELDLLDPSLVDTHDFSHIEVGLTRVPVLHVGDVGATFGHFVHCSVEVTEVVDSFGVNWLQRKHVILLVNVLALNFPIVVFAAAGEPA